MSSKTGLDFWLLWALASALGAGIGFAVAFVGATIMMLSLFSVLQSGSIQSEPVLLLTVAGVVTSGFAGLASGGAVGFAQSLTLPWPADARRRWQRWQLLSWAAGSAVGLPLGMVFAPLVARAVSLFVDHGGFPTLEVTTAIVGSFVGFGTHRALPRPAPPLGWWVAGTVVATTLGWALVFPFSPSSQGPGLPWTNLVVGSLVYGMVSGALMIWADQWRRDEIERAAIRAELRGE